MEGLEKGTEVVTASGIIGKITKMEDDIITLEVGTKVYIRVTRNAISKEMTESVFSATETK
jgi:preprotein translocase subunit YajC